MSSGKGRINLKTVFNNALENHDAERKESKNEGTPQVIERMHMSKLGSLLLFTMTSDLQ